MILTKTIKTAKAEILVVDLPEDARDVNVYRNRIYFNKRYETGLNPDLAGNWQPLGFLDKIPEDVAKELVDVVDNVDGQFDPTCEIPFIDYTDELGGKKFGRDSLHSLVEANCLLKNKHGQEKPLDDWPRGDNAVWEHDTVIDMKTKRREWQAEQEKIFTNPFLLKKID